MENSKRMEKGGVNKIYGIHRYKINWKTNLKIDQAIEHILSDYKRVLKENEELLELKVSASAHNRILELEKKNKNLKATNKDLQKSVDMIYADYQDIGNKAFEYSDKIEQLQKENIELKAKLEYKQYGDLDNIEFEKYINDIVETRTKELKEENEKLKYKYAEYVKFSIRKIEELMDEEGNKWQKKKYKTY